MKLATTTHKDGSVTVTIALDEEYGAGVESMTLGEWSRLIANPVIVVEPK
jgi:hypothetical protein